jgi:tetratricopeptide (TPR) repeat protein
MKKLLLIALVFLLQLSTTVTVFAETPYTTWAWGPNGRPIKTQSAYEPLTKINLDIKNPEDMFIASDGSIFIADTGHKRIVKVVNNEIVMEYGVGLLTGPTGVTVDQDGILYVADAASNTIVIMNPDGSLIRSFGTPTEPLFGKTNEFLPRKIAVDVRKNLYIVSEGSTDGIVQMNVNGNFIGYFGANLATMTFSMILQRLFMSQEQLDQFIKNEAPSPVNVTIDNRNLIYTISNGSNLSKTVRKFNIAGNNIMADTFAGQVTKAIHVSPDGIIMTINAEGEVYEYDNTGFLLFYFNVKDFGDQRLGTVVDPSAIGRYGEFLYILDKNQNAIVTYQSTAFANVIHEGVRLYTEGLYQQAQGYFEQVIAGNGSFILSYAALGNAYYQQRDFEKAASYFKLAESRYWYSMSFWEIRNVFIQNYLLAFILFMVGFFLFKRVFKYFNKRHHFTAPLEKGWSKIKKNKLMDDFLFMFTFIKHPIDGYYYIKQKERGSIRFAVIIFVAVVLVRLLSLYLTGFIFSPYTKPEQIHIENEVFMVLGLIALFIASNYLISTISDGEGKVRDVVIGTAYALFPYVLFTLPLAILSNALTLNEIFIYQSLNQVILFWILINLFIMVKEIQNNTFSENVRNIILTIFTMIMIVLIGYILYFLMSQLYEFFNTIFQEVRVRA